MQRLTIQAEQQVVEHAHGLNVASRPELVAHKIASGMGVERVVEMGEVRKVVIFHSPQDASATQRRFKR